MAKKAKRNGEFDELYEMVASLHVLRKQPKALGMFTDDRELLECPGCGRKMVGEWL